MSGCGGYVAAGRVFDERAIAKLIASCPTSTSVTWAAGVTGISPCSAPHLDESSS